MECLLVRQASLRSSQKAGRRNDGSDEIQPIQKCHCEGTKPWRVQKGDEEISLL
jgi:hypothetical protein